MASVDAGITATNNFFLWIVHHWGNCYQQMKHYTYQAQTKFVYEVYMWWCTALVFRYDYCSRTIRISQCENLHHPLLETRRAVRFQIWPQLWRSSLPFLPQEDTHWRLASPSSAAKLKIKVSIKVLRTGYCDINWRTSWLNSQAELGAEQITTIRVVNR